MSATPTRFALLGGGTAAVDLARRLRTAGADVVGFGAGRWRDVEPTAAGIESAIGHGVAGVVGAAGLFAELEFDAVAVCTPRDGGEDCLLQCLDAGVHVLAQEPIVEPGRGASDRLEMLLDGFAAAGLRVGSLVGWPWLLPAYWELFPDARPGAASTFAMRIGAHERGVEAVLAAMPQVLSVLQSLAPDPDPVLRSPDLDFRTEDATEIDVRFAYDSRAAVVESRIEVRPAPVTETRIRVGDYEAVVAAAPGGWVLRSGDRCAGAEDPVLRAIRSFLAGLAESPAVDEATMLSRLRMVESLVA